MLAIPLSPFVDMKLGTYKCCTNTNSYHPHPSWHQLSYRNMRRWFTYLPLASSDELLVFDGRKFFHALLLKVFRRQPWMQQTLASGHSIPVIGQNNKTAGVNDASSSHLSCFIFFTTFSFFLSPRRSFLLVAPSSSPSFLLVPLSSSSSSV